MKPILHIGYPKTGSTFLQRNIFKPKFGLYNAYDRHFSDVIERIILPNSFKYDAAGTFEYYSALYKDAIDQGLLPVISAEALSGRLFSHANIDKDISYRLKETFPEGKILIVVREQKSIIKSAWRHYMRNNGAQKIDRFIRKSGIKTGFSSIHDMDRFQYHLLVGHYLKLYGKANVLVVPFELLKMNQKSFVNKILEFSGSKERLEEEIFPPENVGRKPIELYIRNKVGRYINADQYGDEKVFLQRVLDKICPLAAKIIPDSVNKNIEQEWDNYLDNLIIGYYRQSNQKLSDLVDVDLKSFNYDM